MRDKQLELSLSQAITVTADSNNVLLLADLYPGNAKQQLGVLQNKAQLGVLLTVRQTFTAAGAATLDVAFQTDDNAAFSSPVTVFSFAQIAKAALVNGAKFFLPFPRGAYEDYCKLVYTVGTGPFTAGKIDAEICFPPGDFYAYTDGLPASPY